MAEPERDRLASLFGALASAADMAGGFHPEKAIRTAVVARRLAHAAGLGVEQTDVIFIARGTDSVAGYLVWIAIHSIVIVTGLSAMRRSSTARTITAAI